MEVSRGMWHVQAGLTSAPSLFFKEHGALWHARTCMYVVLCTCYVIMCLPVRYHYRTSSDISFGMRL